MVQLRSVDTALVNRMERSDVLQSGGLSWQDECQNSCNNVNMAGPLLAVKVGLLKKLAAEFRRAGIMYFVLN